MPVLNPQGLVAERVGALEEFHRRVGQERAELDVSGGVDSATMLALLVRALGADRVTAVFLGINSSTESLARARAAAAVVGARLVVDELGAEFDQRVARMVERLVEAGYDRAEIERRAADDPTVLGSIRSCLRAPLGRGYNRLTGGGIRHGTGNECEDRFLRFYQKGGDGEVDTNPIAMLSKGEVYQLARALGVPRVILEADPSPDLWGVGEQHTDEGELLMWAGVPWTYSRVDPDTGAYTRVGTIERVNRYLDAVGGALFAEEDRVEALLQGRGFPAAPAHPALRGLPRDQVEALLRSARRLERATRHKHNPSIPTLGARRALLEADLLTDALPEV